MRTTMTLLAMSSAVVLPAITRDTVLYLVGASAFVALAAAARRFFLARAGYREHAARVA